MCLGMIAPPDHLTVRPNPARRMGGATASAVARRAKAEGGSDTHQLHVVEVMGFAELNAYHAKCTRGCGCSGHPAFPTPSFGRKIQQRLGRFASRRRVCLDLRFAVIAS